MAYKRKSTSRGAKRGSVYSKKRSGKSYVRGRNGKTSSRGVGRSIQTLRIVVEQPSAASPALSTQEIATRARSKF